MAQLSVRERVSLLMMRGWGDRQRSYNEVKRLFNETFCDHDNGISKSTVERTIRRFEESGTNKNRPKSGRSRFETTEERAFEVAQAFVENPRLSVSKASQQLEMSQTGAWRAGVACGRVYVCSVKRQILSDFNCVFRPGIYDEDTRLDELSTGIFSL